MLELTEVINKVETNFSEVLYFDELDKTAKGLVEEFIISIHSLKDINDHNIQSFVKLFSMYLKDVDNNELRKLIEKD